MIAIAPTANNKYGFIIFILASVAIMYKAMVIDEIPAIRIKYMAQQTIKTIIAYRYSPIVAIIAEEEFAAEGSISAIHDANDKIIASAVRYFKIRFIFLITSPLVSLYHPCY